MTVRRRGRGPSRGNDGDPITWLVIAALALLGLLVGVPFGILWLMETSLERIIEVFCQAGMLGVALLGVVGLIAFLKFFGDP